MRCRWRLRKFALTSLSKSRNCSTSDLLWMRYRATFFRMRPIKSGGHDAHGTLEADRCTLVQLQKGGFRYGTFLVVVRAHDLRRSERDPAKRSRLARTMVDDFFLDGHGVTAPVIKGAILAGMGRSQ